MQIPIFAADGYKYGYMQQSSMQQQMLYNANMAPYATQRIPKNQQLMPGPNVNQKGMQQRGCAVGGGNFQRNNGYQLKVGGVVVGSWAGSKNQQNVRTNRGMVRKILFSSNAYKKFIFLHFSDSISNQSEISPRNK